MWTYTLHEPLGLVEVSCLAGVPEVVSRHVGGAGGGEGEGGVGRGGGGIRYILAHSAIPAQRGRQINDRVAGVLYIVVNNNGEDAGFAKKKSTLN